MKRFISFGILVMFFGISTWAGVSDPNPPVVRSRLYTITTSWAVVTVNSGKIQSAKCENDGANPIRINFDAQVAGQYWETQPGERFPEFNNHKALTINARSVGGNSTLQCIMQSR